MYIRRNIYNAHSLKMSGMFELCIYLVLELQTYARVIGIHAAGSLQTYIRVTKSKGSTGKSCCVIPDISVPMVAHWDKTLPWITIHFRKSQNTCLDGKQLLGWKTLAWGPKHLHRSKTILPIQTLSQITIHFHKYETPSQITKHLHNLNNLSNS